MRIGIGIGAEFSRVVGGAPAFLGILDAYPNAELAYSLRRLSINYTSNLIRVRRSGDNAESNFTYDTSNVLDTAAVQSFCVAGGGTQHGYIVTWYDQSGNAQNLIQATAASQPQIVSSGSIILDNLKPAAQFSGAQNITKSFSAKSQPQSIFSVTKNTTASFGGTFGDNFQQANRPGVGYFFIASAIGNVTVHTANSNQIVTSYILDGANSKTRINAGSQQTGNASTQTQTALTIGSGNYFGFMSGFAQELIQWGSNQNSNESAIRTLMNDYYAVY